MAFSVRASLAQFALPRPSGVGQLTISVAAPVAPAPDAKVPVLYVVDGDMLFGLAAETARAVSSVAGFPAHYVVGIGYDADYAEFLKRRTADLTPPIGAETLAGLGGMGAAIGAAQGGGADAFLAFLTDTLRTAIAERYPATASGPQILYGHSLGGLFAAHALLTRPDSFDAFIVSSPSLWWDDFAILGELPAFRERLAALPRQPRIFVDVGAREQDLPTSVPEGLGVTLEEAQAQIESARMVDAAREFADALRDAGVTALHHIAFGHDDHVSAAPAALLHGMRFALGRDH